MSKNYDRFLKTYSGTELLKKHSPEDTGLWKILGEDPNCDWAGPHHSPELGIVEGRLEDVIRYAVELSNFWTWGGGGNIRQISAPIKVDANTNAARVKLEQEAERLQEQLAKVNAKIVALGGTVKR